MQHIRNGLIIQLTNSLRIIFIKTYLTPKIEYISKNRGPRSKLPHWIEIIYSYVTITCTNKKITCSQSYDTRGQNRYSYWPWGKKVICILFWRLIFSACLSKDHVFSQNLYSWLWKYSILYNEILFKHLFLKPWNKCGRQSLNE